MADGTGFSTAPLQKQVSSLIDSLSANRKRKQDFSDKIQLLMLKEKIAQQFESPSDKLIRSAKEIEAADTAGRPDIARAIRDRVARGIEVGDQGANQGGFGQIPQQASQSQPQDQFGQLGLAQAQQEIPQQFPQSLAGPQDLISSEFKQNKFGEIEPSKIKSVSGVRALKEAETATSESVKKSFKLTDDFVKANRNFLRTTALFSGIVAQLKGKKKEQGGLGLAQGAFGAGMSKLRVPGFGRTASFTGQLDETAIGLNSVLTGQNRVIKSVVEMIRGTLPNEFDPDDFAASKIAQSVSNAFKLNKSFELGILTPEEIENLSKGDANFDLESRLNEIIKLTPEDNANLERMIQGILQTPATKERSLGSPKKETKEELRKFGGINSKEPLKILSIERVE